MLAKGCCVALAHQMLYLFRSLNAFGVRRRTDTFKTLLWQNWMLVSPNLWPSNTNAECGQSNDAIKSK